MSLTDAPYLYFKDFMTVKSWLVVSAEQLDIPVAYVPTGMADTTIVHVYLPSTACPPQYGTQRRKLFRFYFLPRPTFLLLAVGSEPC
jgi:hypothetical protein